MLIVSAFLQHDMDAFKSNSLVDKIPKTLLNPYIARAWSKNLLGLNLKKMKFSRK